MSGPRLAPELLGVQVILQVLVEEDRDVSRLGRKRCEGTVNVDNVEVINFNELFRWRKLCPSPVAEAMVSGSPCLDLTVMNVRRKGLEVARSGPFYEEDEVYRWVCFVFFGILVINVAENVASKEKKGLASYQCVLTVPDKDDASCDGKMPKAQAVLGQLPNLYW